jgi:uncharacterized pyridoxamine 5'-phosphate oxidase family protein
MHETPEDIARLQQTIDASYASAGPHMLRIHEPGRRLTAEQLCERLQGMCLLTLATVTKDGRPITGPVDGIFYRGAFHFSSAPDSTRFRHIRARPQVSATHLPGEHLAVSVHGAATVVKPEGGLRETILGIYVPQYGPEWETNILDGASCARIDAHKLFVFHMDD